jgi:hypothetical protein
MAIKDPTTIVKGKCYRTSSDQHRRVYDVKGNEITYETWGGNVGNCEGHLPRKTVNRDQYAADVEEEISCPPNMKPLP